MTTRVEDKEAQHCNSPSMEVEEIKIKISTFALTKSHFIWCTFQGLGWILYISELGLSGIDSAMTE